MEIQKFNHNSVKICVTKKKMPSVKTQRWQFYIISSYTTCFGIRGHQQVLIL